MSYLQLLSTMKRNTICESVANEFRMIDVVILCESFENREITVMIATRWPNLLFGCLLWLFQWKKLKRYVKDQLPEGTEFEIVLL